MSNGFLASSLYPPKTFCSNRKHANKFQNQNQTFLPFLRKHDSVGSSKADISRISAHVLKPKSHIQRVSVFDLVRQIPLHCHNHLKKQSHKIQCPCGLKQCQHSVSIPISIKKPLEKTTWVVKCSSIMC